ncbi:MAG TPA: FeoB small GTPase domain-containing protein, partial [Saprospiraceae bacterium]|nr:FeoB small GTPase domain-containing protein [Saprospiraceae bacterium]
MIQHASQPIVALLGNPNSGKSSLFNFLTGLKQKVSNFPGVTVEKKIGKLQLENQTIKIIDFPGTYSVFPNSLDERIVIQSLLNPQDFNYPDLVVYVADATQLERHLLFAAQIRDLDIPMVFVLNMADLLEQNATKIDNQVISDFLNCDVLSVSVREGLNMDKIIEAIQDNLI